MSKFDYETSLKIEQAAYKNDWGFYTLLTAVIRMADSENLRKLQAVFPDVVQEFRIRYNAPGGILAEDYWKDGASAGGGLDGDNLEKLEREFPDVVDELRQRYNAPGGRLPEDQEL